MVICFYRFINICKHASTNTQTLLPPPLIFFPSTRFQSPFCFLCHCSSLPSPPTLARSFPSFPLLSLQPSPTAGGEIISNTPSLFLALPSSLLSLSPSKLSGTPSSASCLPSSPSTFSLHLPAFNTGLCL